MSPGRARRALRARNGFGPSRWGAAAGALVTTACTATQRGGIRLPPDFEERVNAQVQKQFPRVGTLVDVLPPSSSALLADDAFEVQCSGGRTVVRGGSRRGALFGLYALAQAAGYGFLHPLHVVVPTGAPNWCHTFRGPPPGGELARSAREGERPGQGFRGTHLHTQHPIELANLLNGVGERDGGESEASWAAGLGTWTLYLQWLVANKQNLVEWALLEWPGKTAGFSTSLGRQRRLADLVARAHAWGIQVSIDAPVNLQQQHAWRLSMQSTLGWAEIEERLGWLCAVGVDMVSTEIGSTEFSKTDPTETIGFLNRTVEYLAVRGKQLVVKNHASTGQYAEGYPDPLRPGADLNFNYITYYADPRVISAPHTIQMYALDDPLVGSYGRRNYTDVRGMMRLMDKESRPQVFFPETAYWVDFDISVPVFLPLYAADRLRDLQLLAREMPAAGHLNFESGWAFGYWLNNAAQALAAWERGGAQGQGEGGVRQLFGRLLAPLGVAGARLAPLLAGLAEVQDWALVQDVFVAPNGAPQTLMGYLEGWDGMAELQEAWQFAVVQPPRLHPRDAAEHGLWYVRTLAPRLDALEAAARGPAAECRGLRTEAASAAAAGGLAGAGGASGAGTGAAALVEDVCVGVELFHLRARQVQGLYAAASGAFPEQGLAASGQAIQEGLELVEGLGLALEWTAWTGTPAPTAYPFGYLWPAATLFFWRRDHQIVAHGLRDACYLNLYDPVEIGLPDSWRKSFLKSFARVLSATLQWLPWFHTYAGCLSGPTHEPPQLEPLQFLQFASSSSSSSTFPALYPTSTPVHVYL